MCKLGVISQERLEIKIRFFPRRFLTIDTSDWLPRLMGPFSVFTVFVGVISSFSAQDKIGNFIFIIIIIRLSYCWVLIGSHICRVNWHHNGWLWVTLNGRFTHCTLSAVAELVAQQPSNISLGDSWTSRPNGLSGLTCDTVECAMPLVGMGRYGRWVCLMINVKASP